MKNIFSILFFALISGYSCSEQLVTLEFEGVDHMMQIEVPNVLANDAYLRDCSLSRAGKCSARFKVENSEKYFQDGNYRSEFRLMKDRSLLYGPDDIFKYKFSIFIPFDYESDPRDSVDIIWQFKSFGNNPNSFVGIKGSDIVLRFMDDGQITIYKNFPKGRWIDLSIEALWSPLDRGSFAVLIRDFDGKFSNYLNVRNIINLRNDFPKANYIKFGIYKPNYANSTAKNPRIVFFDSVKIEKLN